VTSPAPQPDSRADSDPQAPQADPQPQPDPVAAQPDPLVRELQERLLQEHRERLAGEFGLPVELLSGAATPEDVDRICSEALLWQAQAEPQAPPPPPTAAVLASEVTGSTGVISAADRAAMNPRYAGPQTRDQLSRMSPGEIMAAYRSGALSSLGVGPPQRNGATPMTRRR
jgi:hypothetical protein